MLPCLSLGIRLKNPHESPQYLYWKIHNIVREFPLYVWEGLTPDFPCLLCEYNSLKYYRDMFLGWVAKLQI